MSPARMLAAGVAAAAVLGMGYAGFSMAGLSTAVAAADEHAPMPAKVDNFRLADQTLDAFELYQLKDAKAVVLITQMNGCPVSRNIAVAVNEMQKAYAGKGVEFAMLNSSGHDTREAIIAEAKEFGYNMPILLDVNQLVGEQLGVTRTATVFVIDPKTWKIVYRGPIDDRVTYERQKAAATETWAKDAIDSLTGGTARVTMADRESIGCLVNFEERDKREQHARISYSRVVAPIIRDKCAECHQPGGIGPMELTSYEKVKAFSPMIRETLRLDRMPPFHADPSVGKWHDDKSLSATQLKQLVHWIEAGSPRGSGADPLASVKWQAPEWELGKPDLVLDVPAYKIPATGIVEYQRPWVANPLTEGRWIRASTIKVGERQGVHHILTGYMDQVPTTSQVNESRWGASVGGYAVGAESTIWPKDVGTWLPAGGAVGFQNHYTPFGKEATDKSQVALYFYKNGQKPKMMMRGVTILDATITIPANTPRHREVAYLTFPKDAILYSAFPHAHYRGHSSDLHIEYPDGTRKLLLALPKYDFNWQRGYEFDTPVRVPAGSKLIATYVYDNSKRNPANPDPNKVVTWGDQSFEEMFFTALRYRWVDETTDNQKPDYQAALSQSQQIGMMDDNINGKIEMAELRGGAGNQLRGAFAMIDANKDGGLDQAELVAAQAALRGGRRAAAN